MTAHVTPKQRITELDGLRGLAAAMVLVWHFVGALIDQGLWGAKLVYALTIFGRTGVDLFFVLSGFLITGILLDRRQASATKFLRHFYFRRILRIVPSYLVLVAVFWAAVALGPQNDAFNGDIPLWHHLTFTQNWWMAVNNRWGPSAISVTWSVAIEEQFYLVFPLLVLCTPRKHFPLLLIAIAVGSAAFRATAWLIFDNAFLMYVHTLSRLDGLVAGAGIAWAWRHPDFWGWVMKRQVPLRRLFLGLIWTIPLFLIAIQVNLPLNMAVWGHSYLTILYALALALILVQLNQKGTRVLRYQWLGQLGGISYTVYLFHPIALTCTFILAGRPERISSWQDAGVAAGALCATLIWASISQKFLERPLIRAGRRFQY
jgi:peptidoglycan/LPS O-acetylase OafA/YrhL